MGTPLAHRWVHGKGASPNAGRVAVILHGILGSSKNWNTPARKIVQQHPEWRILLVDHRGHGQSKTGIPPHTIESCARDLRATLDTAGALPEVVCGHSFGGKVALGYTALQLAEGLEPPRRTWLFDSLPGPIATSVDDGDEQRGVQGVSYVLSRLATVARREIAYHDRNAAAAALMEEGIAEATALWLAMSTKGTQDNVRFIYDVSTMEALLQAYRTTDLWHVLEQGKARVDLIRALKNPGPWDDVTVQRLRNIPHTSVVDLDAGHNVHVDDLPGVLATVHDSFL